MANIHVLFPLNFYVQALTVIPTCYIFSCPSNNGQNTTPFHALVPSTPSREPGLLLVSSSGNIRYWDSVASGLAGGEHFVTASLSLSSNEEVTTLSRSEVRRDYVCFFSSLPTKSFWL
jgi:nuclear pore complex protein Nup133